MYMARDTAHHRPAPVELVFDRIFAFYDFNTRDVDFLCKVLKDKYKREEL